MISADTSVLIDYFKGEQAADLAYLDRAIAKGEFYLIWPTVLELYSSPVPIQRTVIEFIQSLPCLEFEESTWVNAGKMRALLRSKKLKASFADALIAQCCIDANVPLLTRDTDFRHFEKHGGLKLVELTAN